MIHIAQAIIVEGKYDKIKLSSILDAVILVTNGFHIFHDAEKMSLIRYYAKTTGVIILTDSDTAGFKIRHYLKGAVHEGKLYHVYIPDIYGKERRKDKPSAEGKLGVEGIDRPDHQAGLVRTGTFRRSRQQEPPQSPAKKAGTAGTAFCGISAGSAEYHDDTGRTAENAGISRGEVYAICIIYIDISVFAHYHAALLPDTKPLETGSHAGHQSVVFV